MTQSAFAMARGRPLNVHQNITLDRIVQAVEDSHTSLANPDFCVFCGEETDGCEPDARAYECENCGRNGVYGVEELLIAWA